MFYHNDNMLNVPIVEDQVNSNNCLKYSKMIKNYVYRKCNYFITVTYDDTNQSKKFDYFTDVSFKTHKNFALG